MKSQQGFTLIELLIVIALLGALAVGLLAALDPFEQLKKGTDTSVQNTASEFQGAVIRFFAIKGNMPWCDPAAPSTCNDPTSTASLTPTGVNLVQVDGGSGAGTYYKALTQVMNSGELKSNFDTLAGTTTLGKIYVTGVSGNGGTSPSVTVCYKPTSKSFQAGTNTKFNADGSLNAGSGSAACKSQSTSGTADCYWCIQ